jgi:hypothetical protein
MLQRSIRSGLQVTGQSTEERKAKERYCPPVPPSQNVTGAAQTQNDEKIAATGGNGSPCPRVTGDWGQKQKKQAGMQSEIE